MKHLWGGAQLQVLDIVCSKVLNDFLGDSSEDRMVCGDLMDHSEDLEHLAQGAVTCIALRVKCQGRSCRCLRVNKVSAGSLTFLEYSCQCGVKTFLLSQLPAGCHTQSEGQKIKPAGMLAGSNACYLIVESLSEPFRWACNSTLGKVRQKLSCSSVKWLDISTP